MLKPKIIGLAVLYLGLAIGLPVVLVLAISKTYPIFGEVAETPTPWQLQVQKLTIQPQGEFLLPPTSALTVYKGQGTLLIYPRIDQSYLKTRLLAQGELFNSQSGYRYGLKNKDSAPIEVLVAQVNFETNPNPRQSTEPKKEYSVELISQKYLSNALESQDLKQIVALQLAAIRTESRD